MQIKTLFLGTLDFSEESIIFFPQGILGLAHLKKFILCEGENLAPFKYLVSTESPEIAFLLINPKEVQLNFEIAIDEETKTFLCHQDGHTLIYYVIVTPSGDISETTINLLAPLVLNAETMRGCQIIQEQGNFSVKHRLFEETL